MTAGRAPTKARVRLVPVSTAGAPASWGPGTGLSTGLGVGGGGGRMATGIVGGDSPPSAVATVSGPVTAPAGTRAFVRLSEPELTATAWSSPCPKLPWNTTSSAEPSSLPVIFSRLPLCARLWLAQSRTQTTFSILGSAR